MCQDCPARPSFPLGINIQRKQQWRSSLLRERCMHSLPKSKVSTNSAKQFAPWWEITSRQNVWKNPKPKPKKTPLGLSESDKGLFPALIWKVEQGPAKSRDAFLLILAPWGGWCPTCASSTMGTALGATRPMPGGCCGYQHKPVHSAVETWGSARMSSELRPSSSGFRDGVRWRQLHSKQKAEGESRLLIQIQCSPLEMHGWCIPSILRGEKSHFSCLHPVQMCLGCNESREDMGVKSPSNTHTQRFRRNIFTHLMHVFTNCVGIS